MQPNAIMAHALPNQWGCQLWGTGARAPSPDFQQFHFYFTLEWIWQLTIQLLCNLQDKLVQMSPTHSSFDQYCISHKTISHRAAAAPGPEVYCECLKT